MRLPDSVYDILKWIGLIAMPAVAWFIGQIAPAWGWQNVDAIVTTLNAAGTLLGVLIGVSSIDYYKAAGNGSEDATGGVK